jgi:NDP-sugar pyrophosphorylase family protein
LGTIGPLHLIDDLDDNFLVMNGDVLTDISYLSLFEAHIKRKAVATVATYKRVVGMEYGVLERDKRQKITKFTEKPKYYFDVSMGINVFSREILEIIPEGKPYGFDQLMGLLIEKRQAIFSYPHEGYWLDIGKPDDYARSVDEFDQNKSRFLPGLV